MICRKRNLKNCAKCLSVLVCAATLLAVNGCAKWRSEPDNISDLSAPKMAPDSVVLEIAVARVSPDTIDLEESLWNHVDEQHLSVEMRRRMRENGIRCAIIGSQLPEGLAKILEADEATVREGAENSARRKGEGTWREKKQSRAGQRYKIVTTPVRDRIDVMVKEEQAIRGQTCHQAHCELVLRSFPRGDGSVRLEVTPEIHYGAPRQTYVGDRNGFVIEAKQDELIFEQLRTTSVLTPGQTLIISTTPEITGLGRHFFAHSNDPDTPSKIVLVRLAQTQYDDLFDPDNVLAPIATSTD